jgi:hypothetical protein
MIKIPTHLQTIYGDFPTTTHAIRAVSALHSTPAGINRGLVSRLAEYLQTSPTCIHNWLRGVTPNRRYLIPLLEVIEMRERFDTTPIPTGSPRGVKKKSPAKSLTITTLTNE